MKKEIIIKAENVSKEYRLGQINRGTLTAEIQAWRAKRKGLADPTKQIDEVNWITKDNFMALRNVSFEVYRGDTIGIIGENGAGKSTLLKILSRITVPTSGRIGYNGRISSMLEVGTGFNGELTGRENVYLNGAILGMKQKDVERKMQQITKFSECDKFIDTPVKRYSSGMYVKLAFAVAAHLDSEILIMDEVLAVGDIKFQKKCISKMKELAQQENRTVLYVSHNMSTISQLCNRCLILKKGELVFDGETEEAIGYYNNNSISLNTYYNLVNSERILTPSNVRLLKFEIKNKEFSIFEYGEKMYANIYYEGISNTENAYLRLLINYIDGSIAGITSAKLAPIRSGKQYHIEVEIDISDFASGKYQMLAACWNSDILFSSIPYDAPVENIYFEINITHQNEPYWDHVQAGHRTMKKIRILGGTQEDAF